MRILKLALLGGVVFAATALGSHASASASSLIATLSKGMNGPATASPIIKVQRRRGRGKKRSNRGRNAAAATIGAAAILGLIGAAKEAHEAKIEECLEEHDDVDRAKGIWYDSRGREHPC